MRWRLSAVDIGRLGLATDVEDEDEILLCSSLYCTHYLLWLTGVCHFIEYTATRHLPNAAPSSHGRTLQRVSCSG